MKFRVVVLLMATACGLVATGNPSLPSIKRETLTMSTSSWDGVPYKSYPAGRPQMAVLKITLAPHTTMNWHTHPIPSAAYVLSGDLTVEKKDGTRKHFVAGQAFTETVNSIHRGITDDKGVVLIVFYAGKAGLPLSQSDR